MRRVVIAMLSAALTLAGCASSGPLKVAEAAPVTYRVGDGSLDYASTPSVRQPLRSVPGLPEYGPSPQTPRVVPPVDPAFDPHSVDKELYAHQRVGKTYKVFGKRYTPKHDPDYDETGIASWYGPKFHGKPTANGETFDMHGLSAAHKTLPLNSLVHVTNLSTGKTMILRVNDRGPFVEGRIIDLSKAAAVELGLMKDGLKRVRVRYAGPADPNDLKPRHKPKPRRIARLPDVATDAAPLQADETPKTEYIPLRQLLEQVADVLPQPDKGADILPHVEMPTDMVPFTPTFEALPEVKPEERDEPLTLTIKGPIHLAKSERISHPERIRPASHE